MRRVTILFDHEELYREVKAEAAREGRPVKDVVAEALEDWLRRHAVLGPEYPAKISLEAQARREVALRSLDEIRAQQATQAEIRARREAALALSDELRARLPRTDTVLETLDELRNERS